MSRLFLLIAIIGLVWLIARSVFKSSANPTTPEQQTNTKMIRCDYCGTHVPENEIIHTNDKRYCCEQHRKSDQETP